MLSTVRPVSTSWHPNFYHLVKYSRSSFHTSGAPFVVLIDSKSMKCYSFVFVDFIGFQNSKFKLVL